MIHCKITKNSDKYKTKNVGKGLQYYNYFPSEVPYQTYNSMVGTE